jgi:hypothetical protein
MKVGAGPLCALCVYLNFAAFAVSVFNKIIFFRSTKGRNRKVRQDTASAKKAKKNHWQLNAFLPHSIYFSTSSKVNDFSCHTLATQLFYSGNDDTYFRTV